LSHELRTPLNAVLGWATILKKKAESSSGASDREQLVRGLDAIERNAKAQERLVADLLDVSRIISGKLDLHLTRFDLTTVVSAAVDVVRPAARAKLLDVDVEIHEDARAVTADADRLQQVLWNLLSNAIRFTPSGGRISVTAERVDWRTCIRVRDSGVGIAPEHLSRVFDRFTQVDSSTTRPHGGLGLGLAIVRHIVEAHGGEVRVESEGMGFGATFVVSLPIRALALREPRSAETETSPPTSDDARRERAVLDAVRVLVVDDDDDALEVVRTALGDAGASVTTARTARDALAARGPFDVIVSDIAMPEMDGYELIERMRQRVDTRDIPAIALTAYARPDDVERAKRAGYDAHLSKPLEIPTLVDTVQRSVRRAA
jgi:CheY-like chemotaxis protein/anti-sigma regulatory factor (Ser/Thr protein kinase)